MIGITGGALARFGGLVLGGPSPERVPPSVAAAIRHEQDSSEVLVSLVQAAALVFFAAVYTLTPKAFPPTVPFEPVPIALGFYLLFTLARSTLALHGRLRRGLLVASAAIDVTVLMVTIWSFHLQYGQPAAMYLRAPTLMYLFVLIALRALRFEPGLVLLTGGLGALGWLVLLGWALAEQPSVGVTRSFPEYAMSYAILIGAEVDKVLSILATTAILALALHRGRKLLVRAATEQQAAADLSRFFAPEVAGRIRNESLELRPGQAELREAAILFVDLRGFSRFVAAAPPRAVMELLSEYQACIVGVVRKHGGSIDKFLGDGILASFGATRPSPSWAAQALRAVEELVAEAARWRADRLARGLPAPPVNAALATGRVLFGTVGDAERLEYTVIGEAVNRAAKLEKHCKREGATAVIELEAWQLAEAQGARPAAVWASCPGRRVEGLERPVDLLVLAGEG
ncbi:MAG: adenylate/guanylate cyclase domain-containing protein [Geminicoccaceae bacterium]|nr:adenylate/guanylate cyclase domain-containing protein [Geminicoccaceae bacterium]